MVCVAVPGKALSFALDSVAEWGKFPRFCVKTYRWGDRFFNSYDSAYVKGTGYKMNVKLRTNSWIDDNRFLIDHDCKVEMRSPSTNTIGFDITYLAVSLGYDSVGVERRAVECQSGVFVPAVQPPESFCHMEQPPMVCRNCGQDGCGCCGRQENDSCQLAVQCGDESGMALQSVVDTHRNGRL